MIDHKDRTWIEVTVTGQEVSRCGERALPGRCGCRWALLGWSCPLLWWSPGCCLARSPSPNSRYEPSTTASCRPAPARQESGITAHGLPLLPTSFHFIFSVPMEMGMFNMTWSWFLHVKALNTQYFILLDRFDVIYDTEAPPTSC